LVLLNVSRNFGGAEAPPFLPPSRAFQIGEKPGLELYERQEGKSTAEFDDAVVALRSPRELGKEKVDDGKGNEWWHFKE
jgi:hypothetical protein